MDFVRYNCTAPHFCPVRYIFIFITDQEELDYYYDSDTDVDDGDDVVSNPVMPSCERWPRKQVYASVLPDLPNAPSSTADERDGWYANSYYSRYMDD